MKKTTKKPSKQSEKKIVSKKTSSHKAQAQGPTFEEAREEALTHEGAGRWAEAAETWARAGEVATSRVDRIKAAGAAAAAKVRADAKAVALDQALDSTTEDAEADTEAEVEVEVEVDGPPAEDADTGPDEGAYASADQGPTTEAEDVGDAAQGELEAAGAEEAEDVEDVAPRGGINPRLPPVGTVITKLDRHGIERARCQMVEGGIEYRGTVYRSISAAAMAAAKDLGLGGKTQDGFAFWKLKKAPPRRDAPSPAEALAKAWERYRGRAVDSLNAACGEHHTTILHDLRRHLAELVELVPAS